MTNETEEEIRADERRRIAEQLAAVADGAGDKKLTLADVAKMTPAQVAERLEEVSALQADPSAWDEYNRRHTTGEGAAE